MNWTWKDWLAVSSLVAVFFGGVTWIYKRAKELIKFLEEIEKNKSDIAELNHRLKLAFGKIDGLIYLLNEAFFICNDDGLCILANQYLCDLFGATHEQMAGAGWINFIIPEDREQAWKNWDKGIKSGGRYISDTYKIKNGVTKEIIQIEYHATTCRDGVDDEIVIVSVGKAYKVNEMSTFNDLKNEIKELKEKIDKLPCDEHTLQAMINNLKK